MIAKILTCIQSPDNFLIWWVLIQWFGGVNPGHTLRSEELDTSG